MKIREYERQDIQCIAVDENGRCDRGVRNIKRMLCNKHNSRWQRHGRLDGFRKYPSSDDKEEQRQRSRHWREAQLRSEWSHLTCLCIHTYAEHMIKGKCLVTGCMCKMFSGSSVSAVKQIKDRMATMGFVNPIRDEAYCIHCQTYVKVGRWFDGNIVQRMREHLKYHLTPSYAVSRLDTTA